MCSATLHSRLLLLLSLPAHTPYTHTHSVALRGKGRLPGSVVLFICLEMVVTRQPEWHFCALSAQVTGFSTGLQNTPLETLTDLSAHYIFLFLPLKGVTKATWFLPLLRLESEIWVTALGCWLFPRSRFSLFSSLLPWTFPLSHFWMFHCTDLSEMFVCWAGNLLLNYGCSSCNLQCRDQGDHHSLDFFLMVAVK